mmetsp:Transcript_64641/g.169240  ORF Transcript_64641/g.169240 Transcript_64641/m.169240 type:complete len:226 (+) Transcript_64641:713-1390(+)
MMREARMKELRRSLRTRSTGPRCSPRWSTPATTSPCRRRRSATWSARSSGWGAASSSGPSGRSSRTRLPRSVARRVAPRPTRRGAFWKSARTTRRTTCDDCGLARRRRRRIGGTCGRGTKPLGASSRWTTRRQTSTKSRGLWGPRAVEVRARRAVVAVVLHCRSTSGPLRASRAHSDPCRRLCLAETEAAKASGKAAAKAMAVAKAAAAAASGRNADAASGGNAE